MITHSQSLFGDPYPRQYQKELQPCNSFNPSRPLNPTIPALDSSPNNKNTILPLKLFQHPRVFIQPFPKTIQIPLSLSLSLSLSPSVCFSVLNHWRRWYAGKSHPLFGGERPSPRRKAPSFQVLSRSLSISRCLTLSLTSPLSSYRFCRAIFARRHSCASISIALLDFNLPRWRKHIGIQCTHI